MGVLEISLPDTDELKLLHAAVEGQQAAPGACNFICQYCSGIVDGAGCSTHTFAACIGSRDQNGERGCECERQKKHLNECTEAVKGG